MRKNHWSKWLGVSFILFTACSGDEDRPEIVNKLRAIGVIQNPIAAKPGENVTLEFIVAGPKDLTVAAEPYQDPKVSSLTSLPVTLSSNTATGSDEGALNLYKVSGQVTVPAESAAMITTKPIKLRYGVKMSAGDDNENIVGDILVYPAATELSLAAPTVDIASPAALTSISSSEEELRAEIQNPGGEKLRVGWYASTGEVKNRRAKETKWITKDASKGKQTLIVTIRGTKSGSFAYRVVAVEIP